ncbi:MAG TPA: DUF3313 family protein [Caulobacteraceae bacterium]|jgi:hypothetical protein|nr:DUF3313 family protein [Caulobacteraceae bacterium]
MMRGAVAAFTALALVAGAPLAGGAAKTAPAEWDGLVKVPAKRVALAYLLPGADFSGYHKVMFDPTEVAFQKDWLRDYNSTTSSPSARISQAEADKMLEKVRTGVEQVFAKTYSDAGYQVVTTPGPDVLRLRTAVLNLRVSAPDTMQPGRTRTFSRQAGSAALVIEARDSVSGALLGRAVDQKVAGDMGSYLRNSATNRADFERLFTTWAKASVAGLNELKADSSARVAEK